MKARNFIIYLLSIVTLLVISTGSVLAASDPASGLSLKLKPTKDVEVGDTETIRVYAIDQTVSDITYTWTSSNEAVVQIINARGNACKIKGVSEGNAEITVSATQGSEVKQASCTVIVEQDYDDDDWDDDWDDDDWDDIPGSRPNHEYIPVSSVELNLTTATIPIGKKLELKETVLPRNASNDDVKWSSSDLSIAKVDSDGDVLGLTTGTAIITVETYDGGKTASCTINVVNSSVIPGEPNGGPTVGNPPSNSSPAEPSIQPNPDVTNPTTKYPVFRLYSPVNNEHLYTSDPSEVSILAEQGWKNENVGWNSPTTGEPVYRLYSSKTNEHHYTKDPVEVEVLVNSGLWSIDNGGQPLFYSGGTKPIYRLYHEGTQRHHLTTDEVEYNSLGANGWNKEGAALFSID